jgi:hypothetical protein
VLLLILMHATTRAASNRAILHLHAHLIALKHGWGLGPVSRAAHRSGPPATAHDVSLPSHFANAVMLLPRNASRVHGPSELPAACVKEDYKQHYPFYRHSRTPARCILKVRGWELPRGGPGEEVVVVHFRDGEREFAGHWAQGRAFAPYRYYASALRSLGPPRANTSRSIWIILEPESVNAATPRRLVSEFGAMIDVGDASRAHAFARTADVFIGSFGSFSWIIAYLTCAPRIVLPYFSDDPGGASWVPWSSLFIDDDERVLYADVSQPQMVFEAADAVWKNRSTPFALFLKGRAEQERLEPCYGPSVLCPVPIPVP